jgi:hypothetical protein
VTAQSKAWGCGRSFAGIVGSNPAAGTDVCVLCVLCVVRQRSLRRTYHVSRGVLPDVVCLSVTVKPRHEEAVAHWGLLRHEKKCIYTYENGDILCHTILDLEQGRGI